MASFLFIRLHDTAYRRKNESMVSKKSARIAYMIRGAKASPKLARFKNDDERVFRHVGRRGVSLITVHFREDE
jgi:hypothetical protein